MHLTLPIALAALAGPPISAPAQAAAVTEPKQAETPSRFRHAPPKELFEVVRVVDGDTIHVRRGGELVKLRLLSVDTEERITGRAPLSSTKPETVFGEECALWAIEFFEELGDGGTTRVGLAFPDGEERYDIYGRLLCNVVLPDGTDFNLLLVERGKSPYFNKYGNSRICHPALVAAQKRARKAQLGIWNPATNRPKTPGAPSARRPYDRLLPWWQARADAVAGFRRASAVSEKFVDADSPASLRRAAAADLEEVVVFGQIFRVFDEDDGSRTVLFRSGDKQKSLRVRIARDKVAAHEEFDLEGPQREFRQNYLYVKGKLVETGGGFELESHDPEQWRLAGPEPAPR